MRLARLFPRLGARHGKQTPRVAAAIRELPSDALAGFRRGEPLTVEVDGMTVLVAADDLEIVQTARGELQVQAEGGFTAALDYWRTLAGDATDTVALSYAIATGSIAVTAVGTKRTPGFTRSR